jgi:hypothetical protein
MPRIGSDISSPFSEMDTGKGSVRINLANIKLILIPGGLRYRSRVRTKRREGDLFYKVYSKA